MAQPREEVQRRDGTVFEHPNTLVLARENPPQLTHLIEVATAGTEDAGEDHSAEGEQDVLLVRGGATEEGGRRRSQGEIDGLVGNWMEKA